MKRKIKCEDCEKEYVKELKVYNKIEDKTNINAPIKYKIKTKINYPFGKRSESKITKATCNKCGDQLI